MITKCNILIIILLAHTTKNTSDTHHTHQRALNTQHHHHHHNTLLSIQHAPSSTGEPAVWWRASGREADDEAGCVRPHLREEEVHPVAGVVQHQAEVGVEAVPLRHHRKKEEVEEVGQPALQLVLAEYLKQQQKHQKQQRRRRKKEC
jgi:hypothetical protein